MRNKPSIALVRAYGHMPGGSVHVTVRSAVSTAESVARCASDDRVEVRDDERSVAHNDRFAAETTRSVDWEALEVEHERTLNYQRADNLGEALIVRSEFRKSPTFRAFSDVYRFVERLMGRQDPMHKPRPALDDPKLTAFAVERIETHPFVVRVGGKLTGMYQRGDDAWKALRSMGPRATLHHLGIHTRVLEGAEITRVVSDKAKNQNQRIAGKTSFVQRFRVVCGVSEKRIG